MPISQILSRLPYCPVLGCPRVKAPTRGQSPRRPLYIRKSKENTIRDNLSPLRPVNIHLDRRFNTPSNLLRVCGPHNKFCCSKMLQEEVRHPCNNSVQSCHPARLSPRKITSSRVTLPPRCSKDNYCYRTSFFNSNNCNWVLERHRVCRMLLRSEEAGSKSPSKTPEARQIKHNASVSLQKEIDDAEYHLEEQFQRQLEHDDYSPHSDKEDDEPRFEEKRTLKVRNGSPVGGLAASRFAIADSEDFTEDSEEQADDSEDGPVLHHPQPHSRGHSLSQRPFQDMDDTSSATESKSEFLKSTDTSKNLSDIETNPSNLGTPIPDLAASGHGRAMSISSNPWAEPANPAENGTVLQPPGHSRKAFHF